MLRLAGGTLGLALAKRDFIVVSTESRRTDHYSGDYTDDCKKLFSLGPYRIVSVAGLIDVRFDRLPWLCADLSSLLDAEIKRNEAYHDLGWKDRSPALENVPEKLKELWGQKNYPWWTMLACPIQSVYNIAYTYDRNIDLDKSKMEVLVAGFSENGQAKIEHLARVPQKTISSWGREHINFGQTYEETRTSGPLIWRAIGCSELAESVLQGKVTDKLRTALKKYLGITSYLERFACGSLDAITNSDMIELTEDLILATADLTTSVGYKPRQIATIRPGAPAEIQQPHFPTPPSHLDSVNTWHMGVKFTPDFPFNERPTGVLYTNCAIEQNRTAIPLGDNYFYGNDFHSVVFEYTGGGIFFDNNQPVNCTLFIDPSTDKSAVKPFEGAFAKVELRSAD